MLLDLENSELTAAMKVKNKANSTKQRQGIPREQNRAGGWAGGWAQVLPTGCVAQGVIAETYPNSMPLCGLSKEGGNRKPYSNGNK